MEETPTPKGQLLVPVCPSKSKDSRVDAIGVSMVLSTCSLGLAVSGVCFTKWSQSCSTRKSSRDLESQSVWADDCWCSWRTFASIRSLFGSSWRMSCTKWVPQFGSATETDSIKESRRGLGSNADFELRRACNLDNLVSTIGRCQQTEIFPEAKELGNSAEVPFEGTLKP